MSYEEEDSSSLPDRSESPELTELSNVRLAPVQQELEPQVKWRVANAPHPPHRPPPAQQPSTSAETNFAKPTSSNGLNSGPNGFCHHQSLKTYQGHRVIDIPPRRGVQYDVHKMNRDFWPARKREFERMTDEDVRDYCRHMDLPMARVKKVMKLDDEVKSQMISQDAPLFLAAAAELFIQELTLKAWTIVDEGRRKTLQKNDISSAVARHDHLDFLIDIVPRDEFKRLQQNAGIGSHNSTVSNTEQPVQYYVANDEALGGTVLQFEDGQGGVLQATQIGQPIPFGPDGNSIDLSNLPPGYIAM